MTAADVAETVARVPVTVAVHLEAMNHCPLTRAELRAAVPEALVPEAARHSSSDTGALQPRRP